MKKTIQLSDGSTETMEGTAEEIAAYEKAKREQANESAKPKKRVLLKEEELRALIAEELAKHVPATITVYPHIACTCPICVPCKPYFSRPLIQPWIDPYIEPVCPPVWIGSPVPGTTVTLDSTENLTITSTNEPVNIQFGGAGSSVTIVGTTCIGTGKDVTLTSVVSDPAGTFLSIQNN